MTSTYNISGTISNDKVTIDKFEVNDKDVLDGIDNIETLKNNTVKNGLIERVNTEVAIKRAIKNPMHENAAAVTAANANEVTTTDANEVTATDANKVTGQRGGLFRSPSANLKLAMNNPFATAISSSNNIARDMLTNTVSKTLKSAAPRNNATKRFRRLFKTKRRNSNKKARKYTRYHK